MAEQDILELGLDIDSFDQAKKTTLNEFINLFNMLEKYDGKIFNPVLGGGLAELNKSVKETTESLSTLDTKIKSIGQSTTSITSSSKAASKALDEEAQSALKAAENETRLAAAKTNTAEATTKFTASISSATTNATNLASENNKLAASLLSIEAAENQVVAANEQITSAYEQQAAAQRQIIEAKKNLDSITNRRSDKEKLLSEAKSDYLGSELKIRGASSPSELNEGYKQQEDALRRISALQSELDSMVGASAKEMEAAQKQYTAALVEGEKAEQSITNGRVAQTNATKQLNAAETQRASIITKNAQNEIKSSNQAYTSEVKRIANLRKLQEAQTQQAKIEYNRSLQTLASSSSTTRAANAEIAREKSANLQASALKQLALAEEQATAATLQFERAERQLNATSADNTQEYMAAKTAYDQAAKERVESAVAITHAQTAVTESTRTMAQVQQEAAQSSAGMAKQLNNAFSIIRRLAYILPGLGIAGIFNIIFEAIGKVVEALGWFSDGQLKAAENSIELSNSLKTQYEIYKEIREEIEKIYQLLSKGSSTQAKFGLDLKSAFGVDDITKLREEVDIASKEYLEAREKYKSGPFGTIFADVSNGNYDKAKQQLDILVDVTKELENQRKAIDDIIQAPDEFTTKDRTREAFKYANLPLLLYKQFATDQPFNVFGDNKQVDGKFFDNETLKKQLEAQRAQLDNQISFNKDRIENTEKYIQADYNLKQKGNELNKKIFDETRKRNYELAKDDTEKAISRIESQLGSDNTGIERKIGLTRQLAKEQLELNKIERAYQLSSRENTPQQRQIIESNFFSSNVKIRVKEEEDIHKLQDERDNRRLVADEKIRNAEIEAEAQKNLKIANNEQESYENRLNAYFKYVEGKIEKEQSELQKDLSGHAINAAGDTAQKERLALIKETEEQISNVTADNESKVYNIVFTSLKKQLDLIKDENKLKEDVEKTSQANELKALNDSFEAKKISYARYADERKKIDEKHRSEFLVKEIENSQQSLLSLRTGLVGNIIPKILNAQGKLDDANALPDSPEKQGKVDAAKGELKALLDLRIEYNSQIKTLEEKLNDDLYKLQQKRYDKLTEQEKDELKRKLAFIKFFGDLEKQLYLLAKKYGDAIFDEKIERNRKEQQLREQGYEAEKDAIEKSSLDAKNKAALEIQLEAQKQQSAKNAAAEEKRLKIEKARFDKNLNIAHITLATAESVAEALTAGPYVGEALAIERAAAGALQLAVAVATPIPAYAKGIDSTPKSEYALIGEAGAEKVKIPGQPSFIVDEPTIKWLPVGTEVVPLKDKAPFEYRRESTSDDSWAQARYIASEFKKASKRPNVRVTVSSNIPFENYKTEVLYGR